MRDCGQCTNCLRQADMAEAYVKFGYSGKELASMLRIDRWSMKCTEKEEGDFLAQESMEKGIQASI